MSWFTNNRTRRTEPAASFEGRVFTQLIRNDKELAKRMKQAEYDNSISRVSVDKMLPSLKEIDLRADRAAYVRSLQSGYTKDEAMEFVLRLRNNRMVERAAKAEQIAAVSTSREVRLAGGVAA